LTQQHGETTLSMHQVLEAKLLGPADTVFSIGSAFIDNRDLKDTPPGASAEQRKQDCELKALPAAGGVPAAGLPAVAVVRVGRQPGRLRRGLADRQGLSAVVRVTFKQGRLPALWADFQGLLWLCPQQRVEWETPEGVRQVYRWVAGLSYTDSAAAHGLLRLFNVEEGTYKDGSTALWAWITDLEVNHRPVVEVALKGGRQRWHIENQGFNTQKNSGLNLEHAYSHGPQWEVYYYLLQIASYTVATGGEGQPAPPVGPGAGAAVGASAVRQPQEHGAAAAGQPPLPAVARTTAYDAQQAAAIQIRLDSS